MSCKEFGDEGGAGIREGAIENGFETVRAMLAELPGGGDSPQAEKYRLALGFFEEAKKKEVELQLGVRRYAGISTW